MAVYGDDTRLNGVVLASVTEHAKHIDGIGVGSVYIDNDHHLIINYTDGTTADAGAVSTPDALEDFVRDWLDEHPEATTTVEDGSITAAKLQQDFLDELTATDTTLTEAGMAADAKSVGDKFDELGLAAKDDVVTIAHGGTGASTKALAKAALEILGYASTEPRSDIRQLKDPDGTDIYPKVTPTGAQGSPEGGLYVYKNFEDLYPAATGTVLTETALTNMRANSVAVFTNDDAYTVKLSDAPQSYGLCILFKGKNNLYESGLYFGYGSAPKFYVYLHGSQSSGWTQITG